MVTIEALNNMSKQVFTETLKDLAEHSPWVIQRVGEHRPFGSREALYQQIVTIIQTANEEEKMNLIQAHPHLGTRKKMTSFSESEQKGAGLNELSEAEYEQLLKLNKAYVERFAFPFILAVRGKNKEEIFASIQERLQHSKQQERDRALAEISHIIRFRIEDQIKEEGS
ncbi:2-oxo-4-hydroxy-4-carboxy-5-ureidoimidazoline decarboxylase [Domibacillus indicus]|uniref:2-oxo-4-hydroxy-4-carboxy-5-ureidoimidazoline decarboxylase n=1 Tax=Domibacillus indicus TaxID=1437523 RepID=UPI00203AA0AA|nr:2-oxo-4-hydroxy-4-carboxy-5-ureidoimidazoline decarboxylase [Domibacillus indicus]MCM3788575.1 2-oxo-4-hydroxy-4-carboxy-5-ureidoimidazoline decarboxylase [Domibacillus indicus]